LLSHTLYYYLKPVVPRRVQIAVRRAVVRHQLRRYREVWPIDERAAAPPEGWEGWPDGKKFALVLTHDVEGPRGLANCRPLMEMEKDLGFRSSFNFVAEEYPVPMELLHQMRDQGFEVGLHGLSHDGNMFRSRRAFEEQAVRINRYLKEWGATGFRAPSMYHDLEWLSDLDISYDSSTFDTDPFEPQPDALCTIFPRWIPGRDGRKGYVELPYTLPQDFTLFILLQERGIDIWKRKLDWIAERGGMALLITHPDYMSFSECGKHADQYPARLYREFLDHVRSEYYDHCWPAQPGQVGEFWPKDIGRVASGSPTRVWPERTPGRVLAADEKRRHVLFIVENQSVPYDRRVWAEARSAKEMDLDVTVICPTNERARVRYESIEGIEIFRYPELAGTSGRSGIAFEYLHAFFWQTLLSWKVYLRKPFQIVHGANPPDDVFLLAAFFRLLGSRFVYDQHDLSPELYLTKYPGRRGLLYRVLLLLERFSCRTAHAVVTANDSYRRITGDRHGISQEKIFVVRNDPDLNEFRKIQRPNAGGHTGPTELLYVGSINPQDGVDVLVETLSCLVNHLGERDFRCRVVGGGEHLDAVRHRANQLGLLGFLDFVGVIRDRGIVLERICAADICVEPAPDNELNRYSTFIKVMEYMAAGKPVVAFDLPETRFSARGAALLVPPGDIGAFASAIKRLIHDFGLRQRLGEAGLERTGTDLKWDTANRNMKRAYKSIMKQETKRK